MWPNSQETTDLVTFTEKIFNGKLHFLCSVCRLCWEEVFFQNVEKSSGLKLTILIRTMLKEVKQLKTWA